VAVTPGGTRAYVTNLLSSTVSVIDAATNTVQATLGVGSVPVEVAIADVPEHPRQRRRALGHPSRTSTIHHSHTGNTAPGPYRPGAFPFPTAHARPCGYARPYRHSGHILQWTVFSRVV